MTKQLFTTEQAIKAANNCPGGTRFLLHFTQAAPHTNSVQEFPFGLSGYANITKREAIRILECILPKAVEDNGGRIPIEIDTHSFGLSFWIG